MNTSSKSAEVNSIAGIGMPLCGTFASHYHTDTDCLAEQPVVREQKPGCCRKVQEFGPDLLKGFLESNPKVKADLFADLLLDELASW
jgi:hypothetical protein